MKCIVILLIIIISAIINSFLPNNLHYGWGFFVGAIIGYIECIEDPEE